MSANPAGARQPAHSEHAVRCEGLVKRYDDVVAVAGLDLAVHRGECFGLLGPNGAGKTTTIEILEGLLRPDEGTVEVLGMSWDHDETALRQRLGVQLQETHLSDKLTVAETIRLFRSFYPDGGTVEEMLELVQLSEKRDARVKALSGGQRQRLAVACGLVGRPDLFFLDEPTTGLDPQSRRALWALVEEYRAGGRTVVLTTHYMEEAERLCDRVAIVDRGRVIALGPPHELIAELGGAHMVEFSLPPETVLAELRMLEALPGVTGAMRRGERIVLSVSAVHLAVPALLRELERQALPLTDLTTHHATLEDVFVSLTGRVLRDE
ncbi:MAG: ABC transporter ATP-binding protein [Longimicrobiales bacterium]